MSNQPQSPLRAGGSILAGCILAGAIIGVFLRQSSIGVLVGAGTGLLLLGLMWLRDRRR